MRMSYRVAIDWIALNDDAGNGDSVQEIADYVTTCLVADLSGKSPETVARAIMRKRKEYLK
jgi:hypothetical protein